MKANTWIVARTPMADRYPCRCGDPCGRHCPCKGRPDGAQMGVGCCAYRSQAKPVLAPRPGVGS
jgi:hypothetical protein